MDPNTARMTDNLTGHVLGIILCTYVERYRGKYEGIFDRLVLLCHTKLLRGSTLVAAEDGS